MDRDLDLGEEDLKKSNQKVWRFEKERPDRPRDLVGYYKCRVMIH